MDELIMDDETMRDVQAMMASSQGMVDWDTMNPYLRDFFIFFLKSFVLVMNKFVIPTIKQMNETVLPFISEASEEYVVPFLTRMHDGFIHYSTSIIDSLCVSFDMMVVMAPEIPAAFVEYIYYGFCLDKIIVLTQLITHHVINYFTGWMESVKWMIPIAVIGWHGPGVIMVLLQILVLVVFSIYQCIRLCRKCCK